MHHSIDLLFQKEKTTQCPKPMEDVCIQSTSRNRMGKATHRGSSIDCPQRYTNGKTRSTSSMENEDSNETVYKTGGKSVRLYSLACFPVHTLIYKSAYNGLYIAPMTRFLHRTI